MVATIVTAFTSVLLFSVLYLDGKRVKWFATKALSLTCFDSLVADLITKGVHFVNQNRVYDLINIIDR